MNLTKGFAPQRTDQEKLIIKGREKVLSSKDIKKTSLKKKMR
jgi:hypothetical protein